MGSTDLTPQHILTPTRSPGTAREWERSLMSTIALPRFDRCSTVRKQVRARLTIHVFNAHVRAGNTVSATGININIIIMVIHVVIDGFANQKSNQIWL